MAVEEEVMCKGVDCGKPAGTLTCPNCLKEGRKDQRFCSQECFKKSWATHKSIHTTQPSSFDPWPKRDYTGDLRAAYPISLKGQWFPLLPKKPVPSNIPLPDYANHPKGDSLCEKKEPQKSVNFGRVHSQKEIEGMREACRIAREVLDIAAAAVKPGITTEAIDQIVHDATIERGAYPSPRNYRGFPRSVCTSVNEVICHGIPDLRPLKDGDIVNLDVTVYYNGFHGDLNATYPVGNISDDAARLIKTTRKCLDESIRICKPGTLIRDVGKVIQPIAEKEGFQVNRTYYGHGIDQLFHCGPSIPHYANSKAPGTMKEGMIFTIEPMINQGVHKEKHWSDNWTAVTADGKLSAQFEETLLITQDGCEVLTRAPGWTLPPADTA